MQEENKPIVDDAALWKKNRELQIEEIEGPEAPVDIDEEPPGFIDVNDVEDNKPITATDVRSELNLLKLAQPTASLCVSVIDILIPALIGYFVGLEKSAFKLDTREQETLTDAFANYLKDKNVDLSPGTILIITIVSIYTPKIMLIKMLKENGTAAKD